MAHTLQYYINSNCGDIQMAYSALEFQPSGEWGTCEHIGDLDPDSVDSPSYAYETSTGKYYQKRIMASSARQDFTIVMIVDGEYGNGSFTATSVSGIARVQKDGGEVVVKMDKNRGVEEVSDTIRIYYTSSPSDCIYLPIVQAPLETRLEITGYVFRGCQGEESAEGLHETSLEIVFDTLTDKRDCSSETLEVSVDVKGLRDRFFVQGITKYACMGELDDTNYVVSDGRYYRRAQRFHNGEVVNYYMEVEVHEGLVYEKAVYDNQFSVRADNNSKTLAITNYGRVYLEDGAYYTVTIANVDRKGEQSVITLRFSDN